MFTSTTVAALPVATRWTFVGLLTYADDQGRGRDEARLVKAAVWPMDDDMAWQRVAEHLDELERAGLICRYEVDGKRLLHVSGWDEHQAISHPNKPKLPACPKASHRTPPDGHRQPAGDMPEDHRQPAGGSPEDDGETPLGRERERERERKGSTTVVEQARPDGVIQAVFDAWVSSFPDATRRDLTPARREAITAALRCYPLEDVVDAARGWVNDPWPERAQQNDLAQLLHMGSKRKPLNVLEKMRDLWRSGPPQVAGRRTQEMARNAVGLRTALRSLDGGRRDD